jgi:riboflavin synthase alpha subunit
VFSGIVQAVGVVEEAQAADGALRLRIAAELPREPVPGESVAVNGVCLTVERATRGALEVTAVTETLRVTTLGALAKGRRVNLEPALRVGDPMGGHWVQGHVDAVGTVRSVVPEGEARNVRIAAPADVLRYTVEKGSVCVSGVSLTVTAVDDESFSVSLIPHTLAVTNLGRLAPGDDVNIESDVLAKYVQKLVFQGGLVRSSLASEPPE